MPKHSEQNLRKLLHEELLQFALFIEATYENYRRVLQAIPGCPVDNEYVPCALDWVEPRSDRTYVVGGGRSVPYALDWIEQVKKTFGEKTMNHAPEPAALTFTDAAGNTYPLEVGRRWLMIRKVPEKVFVNMGGMNYPNFQEIDAPNKPFVFMFSEFTPDGKFFRFVDDTQPKHGELSPYKFVEIEHFFTWMKKWIVLNELSPLTADEMKILSLLKLGIDAREAVK